MISVGQLHLELVFVVDRVDLIVHVEHFALVEVERLDDVEESVGVDRFFKGLAEEILPHFRIGDVLEDREHDVIADQALCCAEKAQVAHDDAPFICAEAYSISRVRCLWPWALRWASSGWRSR